MSLARDRTELLEVFLREAEEIVVALDDGFARLRDGAEPTQAALASLVLLAHRLKGAAALHGFRQLSRLAGTMEETLERRRDEPGRPAASPTDDLADLATGIRRGVEAIRTTGREVMDRSPSARTAPDPEARAYFVPEALGYLETLSGCLLALEQAPSWRDDELATLFRTTHTLKGAAYVVGWTAVGDLAHRMEDVLAAVRARRRSSGPTVTDALRAAVSAMRGLLASAEGPAAEAPTAVEEVAARLGALAATADTTPDTSSAPDSAFSSPGRIGGAPASASGARSARRRAEERVERLLALVGELVTARTRLDHDVGQIERLGEHLSAGGARLARALEDFEASRLTAAGPGFHLRPVGPPAPAVLGRDSTGGAAQRLVTDLSAPLELDRYDEYDLLGRRAREIGADLSVVQAQLATAWRLLSQDAARIQRLTGSLRGELLGARLVPMRKLFSRVGRQVRELAAAAGKTVGVEMRGEAVEVDHVVVERMADPLLHLMRNAITHGIEEPDDRQTRGKPRGGTVSLAAYHRGGYVYIEVRDDGHGVDSERLKAQAVRQGLLPREVAPLLEGSEAVDLIFLPGLSTAPAVTSAAGRGIGLDAVRAEVGALNGEISVETEPGVGTRFTIKLPVTLAVSDALVVRVGVETLAIPLTAIRRILLVPPEGILSARPGERIRLENQVMELIRLDRLLGLPAPEPTQPVPVVVLGAGGEPVAVAVGDLLDKEEIVVKGLGGFLDGSGPFAGATVSAEGRVILVLDPVRLREVARTPVPVGSGDRFEPAVSVPDTRSILLVDDSISVRKFVGQMLTRAGFAVQIAADGAEALEILESTQVALVITDLEMPRVNGFELIQELRRRPTTRDLPVVVLTTRTGAQHLSLARWLGVSRYVAKPVDEQEFVSSIAAALSLRERL